MKKKNKGTSQNTLEVLEEKILVDKKKVETGKVTVNKKIIEEEVPLDFTGFKDEIEVEIKKIGKPVKKMGPTIRKEGDTTIFSAYKEVYVKQIVLDKEVWLTEKRTVQTFNESQKRKREEIEVKRTSIKPANRKDS